MLIAIVITVKMIMKIRWAQKVNHPNLIDGMIPVLYTLITALLGTAAFWFFIFIHSLLE